MGGQPKAEPPGLMRRLACFFYEGVLLFGVVMVAGLLYAALTQQRHALEGKLGLQVFVFAVVALYFTWFWSHGGQTLAMKTWHIRLQRADGQPLGTMRALVRYVVCWVWFLPALGVVSLLEVRGVWPLTGFVVLGVLSYAGLAQLRQDRRFWHDVLCDTSLVTWIQASRKAKSSE